MQTGNVAYSRWMFAPFLFCVFAICFAGLVRELDRQFPPPLQRADQVSMEVVDRHGKLLRAFATPQGRWRLKADLDRIDPRFVSMLLAYEDKRFHRHNGVDYQSLVRAALQLIEHGRIVSGGSTITMQLARLLEGRPNRSIKAKLFQIVRAWQIERRLSKQEILTHYLTLAPYGGNLEGVRAASLAYFGKEPENLSVAQAALLVALPQNPEMRRPDRRHRNALAARNRVLERMVSAGLFDESETRLARHRAVPSRRLELPVHAAHLAQRLFVQHSGKTRSQTTLDRDLQDKLERLARLRAGKLHDKVSIAMVVADASRGDVLASVGSSDFLDHGRLGENDMTLSVRSPGSALKPFIYGLAFQDGLVHPSTLIDDTPASFAGYRPGNFDSTYQGRVTVRKALQKSLNIPAIRLLDQIGVARFMEFARIGGATLHLPDDNPAGLAVGLGGVGINLRDLTQLYATLVRRGNPVQLTDSMEMRHSAASKTAAALNEVAAWYVTDILSGVEAPENTSDQNIAYKTGTSYGYRDAWSIGFDGQYVIGIWVGRPDGVPVPGISGRSTAAPVLFEAFSRLGVKRVALPLAPAGVIRAGSSGLPVALKMFAPKHALLRQRAAVPEPAPRIVYPPNGVNVDLVQGRETLPLVLKLTGGRAPFRWLINGKPASRVARRRQTQWVPTSVGYSELSVVDAAGRTARVTVFVE